MTRRTILMLFSIMLFVVIELICLKAPAFAAGEFLINNIVPDEAGNFLIVSGQNTSDVSNYKVTKLDSPDRVVIDIPNAVLAGQKKVFNLANSGVTVAKIAQFATNPDIVRLVFIGDSKESVKNISFHKSENSLIFKLNNVEVQRYIAPVIYNDQESHPAEDTKTINVNDDNKSDKDKMQSIVDVKIKSADPLNSSQTASNVKNYNNQNLVINKVNYINSHITLSGAGSVSINEPFVLQNPTRLVIDLPNASVSDPEILKGYTLDNTDIVRVGQFNPETLRVVVETNNPDNYKTIISPDLQTLVIAPKFNINLSDLPDGNNISLIQDIKVKQVDDDTTVLTLVASQPLIHNVRHQYRPYRLNLELFNVNAPKKSLVSNLPKTEQFKGIDISYIEKYPLGSSWNIQINRGTKVETKLSMDGKFLELILKSINIIPTSKARVVIDAGHGGNEPGANRAGMYEKYITLNVAKKVYKYLSDAGVDATMTREGDDTLSLKGRTDITNSISPDLFVSIHVNACENSVIKGLETHYYTPQSRNLAKVMQTSLVNTVGSPNRGIVKSMFYVIHHTEVPAVLVEIGFISNEAERCLLVTDDHQDTTARAIADGILQYLGIRH